MAGTTHSVCESTSESHLCIRSPKIQHFSAPNGVSVMPLTPLRRLLSQPMSLWGTRLCRLSLVLGSRTAKITQLGCLTEIHFGRTFSHDTDATEQPRPGEKTYENRTSLLAALAGVRHAIHSRCLPIRCNALGPCRPDVCFGPHPLGKPCLSSRSRRAKPRNRSSIQ